MNHNNSDIAIINKSNEDSYNSTKNIKSKKKWDIHLYFSF